MRVLIVPDKFKGTLTAKQAAAAIARGWHRSRPGDLLECLPMSDGGDGFGEVMSSLLGARSRIVHTVDAAHRPLRARWWWEVYTRTAIVESAGIIGLAMLPAKRFHPFQLDTVGLGNVLRAVERLRPRRCFIGIGGSATNDGGFGMARAVGWRFLTSTGEHITAWPELARCRQIIPPRRPLNLGQCHVALDVRNPLLGMSGCTRVYGPQKGLLPRDFKTSETALQKLSHLMDQGFDPPMAKASGAGAAGGLGFGLMAFLRAKPISGFSLFAREADLDRRLHSVDLVITGEGCLDRQSLMGKGLGELAALCKQLHVPCIAIVGSARGVIRPRRGLSGITPLDHITSTSNALGHPSHWLARAAEGIGLGWGSDTEA